MTGKKADACINCKHLEPIIGGYKCRAFPGRMCEEIRQQMYDRGDYTCPGFEGGLRYPSLYDQMVDDTRVHSATPPRPPKKWWQW